MRFKELPPVDVLRNRFDYDPEAGTLIRKWRTDKTKRAKQPLVGKAVGTMQSHGYLSFVIDGQKYWVHRLIWKWWHGAEPDGVVDHINHDRSDNRIENLRVVDYANSGRNTGMSRKNTSGVCGISWNSRDLYWETYITVNYKRIVLGYFHDKRKAIAARKAAEIKYGFHENHGKPKGGE